MIFLIYNDASYAAEVHHFGPDGFPTEIVRLPDPDIAATARGMGCAAVTVRNPDDLRDVRTWLAGPRERPLVIDAKIADFPSWVMAHSFEHR